LSTCMSMLGAGVLSKVEAGVAEEVTVDDCGVEVTEGCPPQGKGNCASQQG
jgi:hypothetical protein